MKNVLKGFLLLSVLLIISCKSTDVEENEETAAYRANKNYVGWVDSTGKDVVYKKGSVQIKVKQNLGTYNIGVINADEKVLPVLSTSDEFTTSVMYLRTSKKTYVLRKDGAVKSFASRKNNGIGITYSVDKAFDLDLNFETMESGEYDAPDMLKVTYTITNTGTKKEDFSLKAIFDTVLGETDKYHFYTSENLPVKNEIAYRTMQNQKWIMSKNRSAAMEFIFNGADTTAPELVALANYSTFQKNSWEPEMLTYRAFDTVLSYNNSAVGVIWPTVKIKPSASSKIVFYMSFAADGNEPAGHKKILKNEEKEINEVELNNGKNNTAPLIQKIEEPVPNEIEKENITEAPVETPVKNKVPEKTIEKEPVKETPVIPDPVPEVEETVNGLKKYQLSPEYIQGLIDRITELEQNSSNVNLDEIERLNEELDEILSALR